ncbi:SRPBCC family protein [Muricauda sp. SCSIO 64092]|uniref:SRPBCC family protein n=1 Tax=Allomuricauda sp. SCSIO 64092 TaxID=2908842 RepID=UPI001FF6CBF0|nr:SRPBCC family protein [Muricauda sp. SCSIO 64092]UOY08958.1 SRPBCC family protein [Muricauda sp. SCSIO 64092]
MGRISCREQIAIEREQRDVFDYTQNYRFRLDWDTLLSQADLLDGVSTANVGAKAHCVAHNGHSMVTRYITFNRPERTAIEMIQGPYMFSSFHGCWVFKATSRKATEVSFLYSYQLRFPFNLVGLMVNRVLRQHTKQRLASLKRNLESP